MRAVSGSTFRLDAVDLATGNTDANSIQFGNYAKRVTITGYRAAGTAPLTQTVYILSLIGDPVPFTTAQFDDTWTGLTSVEFRGEGGDLSSRTWNTFLIDNLRTEPMPDLTAVVKPEDVPDYSVAGRGFSVPVEIKNTGNVAASAGSVTVEYYLSSDQAFSKADDVLAGTKKIQGLNLGAGSSATYTGQVTIPYGKDNKLGKRYLLAVVDSGKVVIENNEDNNVAGTPLTILPKVVNVATHGFGSGLLDFSTWDAIGRRLETVPEPGTKLEGQIKSFVPRWESTDGFAAGLAFAALSVVCTAALQPGAAIAAIQMVNLSAAISRGHAERAANDIVQSLTAPDSGLLADTDDGRRMTDQGEDQGQVIHLVGHSRGGSGKRDGG